jgi:O-acetylhomoserine (thiol)-lyase
VLVFQTIMEPGAEFVSARQLYGGSVNQFTHSFSKYDWHVRWADSTDADSFKRAVTDKTRAIFCESIANPGGVISDLEGLRGCRRWRAVDRRYRWRRRTC